MSLKLHQLKSRGRKPKKRLGRGNASGSGNYSSRGMKGQKSRSGGKHKGGFAGKRYPAFIRQIPKKRGFLSIHPNLNTVNLEQLNEVFKSGEVVEPKKLLEMRLVNKIHPGIKILGKGKLSKKLTIKAHRFSKTAFDAIKKAGGEAIIIEPKKK